MPNATVRAAGHQLGFLLLRHRRAPLAAQVQAGANREGWSAREENEPEPGTPWTGVQVVTAESSQPNQHNHYGGNQELYA